MFIEWSRLASISPWVWSVEWITRIETFAHFNHTNFTAVDTESNVLGRPLHFVAMESLIVAIAGLGIFTECCR